METNRAAAILRRVVPGDMRDRFRRPRSAAVIGSVLVILALLFGHAGLAIAIASLVVPAAVLIELSRRDVFETEPWWILVAVGAGGFIAGVAVWLLNILILKEFGPDRTPLRDCCGGFVGKLDWHTKNSSAVTLVLLGLFMPVLAEVAQTAGPFYLRRWPAYRNEVMDGITLGAAAGGGFAAAWTMLYFYPLLNGDAGGGSVSGWTASLLGLLLVRPLIFSATTGLLCAGIWHFSLSPRPDYLAIAIAGGLAGAIIYAIGDLIVAPHGTSMELVWGLVVLVPLAVVVRYVVDRGVAHDRRTLVGTGQRLVCPTCRRLTPPGSFCALCGAALPPIAGDNLAAPPPAEEPTPPHPPAATETG